MKDNHTPHTQAVESELKANTPQADAGFQNRLENQLMTHLHDIHNEQKDDAKMAKIKRKQTGRTTYLTLAAAIIAIIIVGGLVFFTNVQRQTITADMMLETATNIESTTQVQAEEVQATALASLAAPTYAPSIFQLEATQSAAAEPTVDYNDETYNGGIPIMIAARDIAVGEIITREMVYRVFWPRPVGGDAIERNGLGGFYGNVGNVLGKEAIQPIRAFNPIDSNSIIATINNGETQLPVGNVAMAIGLDQINTPLFELEEDMTVRVLALIRPDELPDTVPFVIPENHSDSDAIQYIVTRRAQIISVETDAEGNDILTIALIPSDANALRFLLEAEVPITLSTPNEASSENVAPYILPPDGFIGDYASLNGAGNVRVFIFFSIEEDVLQLAGISDIDMGINVYSFDAFVNVGSMLYTDDEGNQQATTSARILTHSLYLELLETLRLHNIPYTYTLVPRITSEQSISTSEDDYVIINPSPERLQRNFATPITTGQTKILIIIPDYDNSLAIDNIAIQSDTGILLLDGVTQIVQQPASTANPEVQQGNVRFLLTPEDAPHISILEASGLDYYYTIIPQSD